MTIRHEALGIHDHAAGSGLASDLTHELGMRLQDWGASADRQYHWMLRHEADCDGDLVTRVMMSVPSDRLRAAIHWARNRFLRRRAGTEASSALLIACRDGGRSEREQRVRFHWACVRALSRSLDPAELGRSQDGRRTPLVDLLRIPRRWRGPTGNVRCSGSASLQNPLDQTLDAWRLATKWHFSPRSTMAHGATSTGVGSCWSIRTVSSNCSAGEKTLGGYGVSSTETTN